MKSHTQIRSDTGWVEFRVLGVFRREVCFPIVLLVCLLRTIVFDVGSRKVWQHFTAEMSDILKALEVSSC